MAPKATTTPRGRASARSPPEPSAPPPSRARSQSRGKAQSQSQAPSRAKKSLGSASITGGCGFVALRLAAALVKEGYSVRLLDLHPPPDEFWEEMRGKFGPSPPIAFVRCDLRDRDAVSDSLRGQAAVFHMGSYGMSGVEQLMKDKVRAVNIGGTRSVLSACLAHSVPRLIYTSTYNVAFYGPQIIRGGDDFPLAPPGTHVDAYSSTKAEADRMVTAANGSENKSGSRLATCCIRPAGIYGPGETRHIPRVIGYMQQGLYQFTVGPSSSLTDWVHVDNLVAVHVLADRKLREGGVRAKAAGKGYFISDDRPINNFEFFRPLTEGLGYSHPSIAIPVPPMLLLGLLMEWLVLLATLIYPAFRPPFLLTRCEVLKCGVTHYFDQGPARRDLGYVPKEPDMDEVVRWYLDRGYGREASDAARRARDALPDTRHWLRPLLALMAAGAALGLVAKGRSREAMA